MTDTKPNASHILIIEDEIYIQEALHDQLISLGYGVTVADNGHQGLARALARHPDLILLDIFMPIMGGIEMLTELRKDSWGSKVPVIILTNTSDFRDLDGILNTGIKDYIIKSDTSLQRISEIIASNLPVKPMS